MSKQIEYNKKTLDLVRKLSDIQSKILFEKSKEGDKLLLDSRNDSNTVAYYLSTPLSDFNFDGDDVAFYDFREFYSLMSVYEDPQIIQNINNFEFGKGKSKNTYYIADSEIVEKEYDYIQFDESHAQLMITSEDFKKIKTQLNLTKAENVSFLVEDGKFFLKLFGEENQPTFEEEMDLKEECTEDFEVVITKHIFVLAPEHDYDVYINSNGIVKFSYINDEGISLDLYTAEQER